MNGNGTMLAGVALFLAAIGWVLLQQGPDETVPAPEDGTLMVRVTVPADLSAEAEMGKQAFEAACVTCHGENAAGRHGMGPPLIHKIYEPGHHADMAFQLAVQNGVRSHHWRFGDMPPVEGLTRADVASIVTYVREVQRENGID